MDAQEVELIEAIMDDSCVLGASSHNAIILCDIDGPLLDCSHRLAYLEKKEYDKFYGVEMSDDLPHSINAPATLAIIVGIMSIYGSSDTTLFFNTGRPARTHSITRLVLKEYFPTLIEWAESPGDQATKDNLFVYRADNDWRPAGQVKVDNAVKLFSQFYSQDRDFSPEGTDLFVIDDDQEVLDEFRDTFQFKLEKASSRIGKSSLALLGEPSLIKIGDKTSNFEQNKSPEE